MFNIFQALNCDSTHVQMCLDLIPWDYDLFSQFLDNVTITYKCSDKTRALVLEKVEVKKYFEEQ